MRATVNRGKDAHADGKLGTSDKSAIEIMKLLFTPDGELYDERVEEMFNNEVLNFNF